MITSAFEPPHLAVDAGVDQAFCSFRVQQQMTDGFSLGGNRRFAVLTLIHSVQNHTDDDGNYGTTHTTADQLTGDRC